MQMDRAQQMKREKKEEERLERSGKQQATKRGEGEKIGEERKIENRVK